MKDTKLYSRVKARVEDYFNLLGHRQRIFRSTEVETYLVLAKYADELDVLATEMRCGKSHKVHSACDVNVDRNYFMKNQKFIYLLYSLIRFSLRQLI